ncbi:hypothetical protein BD408DRAFT_407508 [Parasitella parasitica]|nr:hypothetical protein BD408DRAFT_407508 [Parasitella parasitica]
MKSTKLILALALAFIYTLLVACADAKKSIKKRSLARFSARSTDSEVIYISDNAPALKAAKADIPSVTSPVDQRKFKGTTTAPVATTKKAKKVRPYDPEHEEHEGEEADENEEDEDEVGN